MKGEKEAGHKGTREVGNVDPDTDITFQFRANEKVSEGEENKHSYRLTPLARLFSVSAAVVLNFSTISQLPRVARSLRKVRHVVISVVANHEKQKFQFEIIATLHLKIN